MCTTVSWIHPCGHGVLTSDGTTILCKMPVAVDLGIFSHRTSFLNAFLVTNHFS